MKVLLINPTVDANKTVGFLRKAFVPIAPLGIAYLAAVLKKHGHAPTLLDQFETGMSPEHIAARVEKEGFRMVGFSILTPNMPSVQATVEAIRSRQPATYILFGNTHATIYQKELVEQGQCDFVIGGEGEHALVDLVNALARGQTDLATIPGLTWQGAKGVTVNPKGQQIKNLDELPFPLWDDLNIHRYQAPPTHLKTKVVLPIIYTRGCPWNCSFCAQNVNYPMVRKRSLDNLLDEIEHNIEKYHVNWFGFQDAIFPLCDRDAFKFAEAMIKRGLHRRCQWSTEARVDTVSYDSLAALKEAGLYLIMYGFESGNDRILKLHQKKQTLEDGRKAMAWTRKLGIFTYGLFMLGLPGETEETMRDTVQFSLELDPEVAKFSRFTPYPGSPLFFQLKSELDQGNFNPESMTPWSTGTAKEDYAFCPEGISVHRMRQIQRNAVLKFYLRPRKILQMSRINLRQPTNLLISIQTIVDLLVESFKASGAPKELVSPQPAS